jgi:hypothetical protein
MKHCGELWFMAENGVSKEVEMSEILEKAKLFF